MGKESPLNTNSTNQKSSLREKSVQLAESMTTVERSQSLVDEQPQRLDSLVTGVDVWIGERDLDNQGLPLFL
jgi:hypothetical protein